MPEIGRIITVGENSQKIEVKLDAVNKFVARQRARSFLRRNYPVASISLPDEHMTEETEQGTFTQFFPESIQAEEHSVFFIVTKRTSN